MYPCSIAFQRQRFPLPLLRQQNSDKWIPGRGWQCMKNIDLPYNPIYPNLSCISICNLLYRISIFMLCVAVVFSTGLEHEFIASNPFIASESLYFPGEMATELL